MPPTIVAKSCVLGIQGCVVWMPDGGDEKGFRGRVVSTRGGVATNDVIVHLCEFCRHWSLAFANLRVAHEAQFVRHKAGRLARWVWGEMAERCEDAQCTIVSKIGRVIRLGHRQR